MWQELFGEATRSQEGFAENVEQLLAHRERIQALTGKDDVPDWDRRIADLLLEHLGRLADPLVPETAGQIVAALGRCQLKDPEHLGRGLVGVQERLQPPATLDEIEAVFGMFEPFGPAGHIPFPSRLYTDEVLRDYANRFPEEGFTNHLKDRNPLEQALRQLKAQQAALERTLGLTSLSQLPQAEEYSSILQEVDVMQALTACKQWTDKWDNLCRIGPALSQVLPGTGVVGIHESVHAVSQLLESNRRHMDTRVETDHPELEDDHDEYSGANGRHRRPRSPHRKKRHHNDRHRSNRRKNRR